MQKSTKNTKGAAPKKSMKKRELEEMVKQQADLLVDQAKAHEREIRILLDAIDKLKGEPEMPRPLRRRRVLDKQEPETDGKPEKSPQEERKEEVLRLFKKMGPIRQIPGIEEFVKRLRIMNLEDVDDATFTVLIRQHFNRELADAYAARMMPPRVYTAMVHYFDEHVDEKPLEVADEFKAELEQLRADAAAREEQLKLLNPTEGPFRLRGREELEKFLNEQVVDIVNNSEHYALLGIHFPKGFILEGPPGCGKTFAVERLAEHLKWNIVRIDSGSIGSTFIHGTSKKIQEKFEEAEENAPSIVIIDEMEAFTRNRGNLSEHDNHRVEEVDSFLQCLQRAEERHILVVGMTNHIESVDPAILRTGRLGTHIQVGMPSLEEVQDVLAHALEKRPHQEFGLRPHAERLLDHPLSDVTHAVDEAAMCAARARRKRVEEADLSRAIDDLLQHQEARNNHRKPIGFAE